MVASEEAATAASVTAVAVVEVVVEVEAAFGSFRSEAQVFQEGDHPCQLRIPDQWVQSFVTEGKPSERREVPSCFQPVPAGTLPEADASVRYQLQIRNDWGWEALVQIKQPPA